jgi:hypothetical protein
MSSLAAARADNFYYPPGFDPEKHGSLNKARHGFRTVQLPKQGKGAEGDSKIHFCSFKASIPYVIVRGSLTRAS